MILLLKRIQNNNKNNNKGSQILEKELKFTTS